MPTHIIRLLENSTVYWWENESETGKYCINVTMKIILTLYAIKQSWGRQGSSDHTLRTKFNTVLPKLISASSDLSQDRF